MIKTILRETFYLLLFFVFWIYMWLMFDEIINDSVVQLPTAVVYVPNWYKLLAQGGIPLSIMIAWIASKIYQNKAIFLKMICLLLTANWLYLTFGLPEVLMGNLLNHYSPSHRQSLVYVLSIRDMFPMILLDFLILLLLIAGQKWRAVQALRRSVPSTSLGMTDPVK